MQPMPLVSASPEMTMPCFFSWSSVKASYSSVISGLSFLMSARLPLKKMFWFHVSSAPGWYS